MPTSVRLDPKTERVIRALARRTGRTQSEVIRDAIHRFAAAESEERRGQTAFDLWKDAIGCANGRAARPVGAHGRTFPFAPPGQAARMTLVDAGPLVAILHRDDRRHRDCVRRCKRCRRPLGTTWPVVTEAMYLLGFAADAQDELWGLLETGRLQPLRARRSGRAPDAGPHAEVPRPAHGPRGCKPGGGGGARGNQQGVHPRPPRLRRLPPRQGRTLLRHPLTAA